MKNKKGFTLVELLAVVVILGILSSITVLAVVKIKQRQDVENLRNTISGVLTGANNYMVKNPSVTSIQVSDLVDNNYIDLGNYDFIKAASVEYNRCVDSDVKRKFSIVISGKTFDDCGCDAQVLGTTTSNKLCTSGSETLEDNLKHVLNNNR